MDPITIYIADRKWVYEDGMLKTREKNVTKEESQLAREALRTIIAKKRREMVGPRGGGKGG